MSALVDALGLQAVRTLANLIGGRQLRIPRMSDDPGSMAARARLVERVGRSIAEDLLTNFAGTRVYIPRGPTPHNSRANPIDAREVARLTKRRLTASAIAERLGCTERTVFLKRAQHAQSRRKP